MGNCIGLGKDKDAVEVVELQSPLAQQPPPAAATKGGRGSKPLKSGTVGTAASRGGDSFVDVLFFPDPGMPCKNFRSEKGCTRKNCKKIHDEGSSLLTLLDYLNNCKKTMDICVFTITCDEIAECVLAAHERGVVVRVISDDDMAKGKGSDIQKFIDAGITVRDDNSRTYMHNKFCIIDNKILLNGSFNWSRQAVVGNQENLVINAGGPVIHNQQHVLGLNQVASGINSRSSGKLTTAESIDLVSLSSDQTSKVINTHPDSPCTIEHRHVALASQRSMIMLMLQSSNSLAKSNQRERSDVLHPSIILGNDVKANQSNRSVRSPATRRSRERERETMMMLRNLRRSSLAASLQPRWNTRALSTVAPSAADVVAPEVSERLDTLERIQATPARERFRVALVGRTNVGKSTLYNRLTKTRSAIVHNVPGTTRDRRYAVAHLAGMEFDVIDTGGLEDAPSGTLEEGMLEQTRKAVHEADLVFFLVDGRQGVTPIDSHFARWLRRENSVAPVHLVANKVEGYPDRWEDSMNECYQLGLGSAIPLSAEHGEGITNLIDVLIPAYDAHEKEQDELLKDIPKEEGVTTEEEEDSRTIRLAIVGRPNVGKSTLLNRIVRKERVLTGPEPGVTRDSVEVPWSFRGQPVKLVDTAGIRKYSKRDHENQIENLSVRDAFRAIDSAQVVIVVVDISQEKLIHMDLTIAHKVIEEGRGLIIAANKADLTEDSEFEMQRIRDELGGSLAQVKGVPVVPISALTGKGIRKLLPEVMKAYEKWDLRVTTGRLNRWMKAMARHHPPPTVKGKTINVKYVTQVKSRPPTFALFVNKPNDVPESYQRFLLTQLREEFDMVGVPARLLLRGNSESNPFEKRTNFKKRTSSVTHGKARKNQNPSPKK